MEDLVQQQKYLETGSLPDSKPQLITNIIQNLPENDCARVCPS